MERGISFLILNLSLWIIWSTMIDPLLRTWLRIKCSAVAMRGAGSDGRGKNAEAVRRDRAKFV